MATKDQLIALHTQVNSIEGQLRGMKHFKLEDRVAAIEQEVFGEIRVIRMILQKFRKNYSTSNVSLIAWKSEVLQKNEIAPLRDRIAAI